MSHFQDRFLLDSPQELLQLLGPETKNLTLKEDFLINPETLLQISSRCPKLTSINFYYLNDLNAESYSLFFQKTSNLEEITLHRCKGIDSSVIQTIKQIFYRLRRLRIEDCNPISEGVLQQLPTCSTLLE